MNALAKLRPITLLWLVWVLLIIGYQIYVQARFAPKRPDFALTWTADETQANSQRDKPYLLDPFLNDHVSWDSEYYLSIAVGGYDDPQMRAIPANYTWDQPQVSLKSQEPTWISMNYAFFPFYPFLIHMLAIPLTVLGLTPIATATLAGVAVSALGTLGAMIAIYDLTSNLFDETVGKRAAFYLLIFPAAMFLLQVYSEGLFLGLSFGALALARREKWLWAGLLAACAMWTRPVGTLLLLPLVWYWWRSCGWQRLTTKFSWAEVGKVVLICSPLLAYLLWQAIFGGPFHIIESRFYSREVLALGASWTAWSEVLGSLFGKNTQMTAYYLVEFAAIIFSLITCALMWKYDRLLAIYSLVVIVFSLTTGVAQGMHRYVMAAPAVFMIPARWGKSEVFDRAWTVGNVLLMGVFVTMFSFDFWAG
jgi:hypothetical protein